MFQNVKKAESFFLDGQVKSESLVKLKERLREDNVSHLMALGHATVQMMHKTPSLWKRDKMPWIFGNAKQIQNQRPSLCAPWSVHVDRHLKIFETRKT